MNDPQITPMSQTIPDDPYHDRRVYHMAKLTDGKGGVSPLCAKKPRRLNLARHQLWTIRWEAVTCSKCLACRTQ